MPIPKIGDGPNAVENFLREEDARAHRKRVARRERAFTEAAVRHADFWERLFKIAGFQTAAENLRRFREGRGGEKIYSREEIEQHRPIVAAEEWNRTKFEGGTFVGKTNNKNAKEALLTIQDGEELPFSDHWNRNIGPSSKTPKNILSLGTYAAFGRGLNRSDLAGKIRRRGDEIIIEGTVSHGFETEQNDNRYDFNPGQQF